MGDYLYIGVNAVLIGVFGWSLARICELVWPPRWPWSRPETQAWTEDEL